MDIVKLGNLCNISTGNLNKEDENKKGEYKFYTRSTNIIKSDSYSFDGEYVVIPGEGVFIPLWNKGKCAVHQRVYVINSKNINILKNKYLFYWWSKNNQILYKESTGSTVKSLRKINFESPLIKLIKINDQQSIIDIIEPFEILVELIFKKIKINEKIAELIINNFYRKNGLFKENEIEFFKGINFKKGMISENNSDILFINVSAINNKPNKFIKLEYINMINVFEGDVVLSLDGNTGLVNNCLKGINGYGYKIASNKIKNSQIYYSLLSKINQDIIDQNSFGTTIQHASKSKDKIILLNFSENQKILDIFFDLEIIYKKKAKLLKKIISSLIEIYTR